MKTSSLRYKSNRIYEGGCFKVCLNIAVKQSNPAANFRSEYVIKFN